MVKMFQYYYDCKVQESSLGDNHTNVAQNYKLQKHLFQKFDEQVVVDGFFLLLVQNHELIDMYVTEQGADEKS